MSSNIQDIFLISDSTFFNILGSNSSGFRFELFFPTEKYKDPIDKLAAEVTY